MRVPLLNCEGGPAVLLLNFEGGPGVPLVNFRGVPGPTFKLRDGSRVAGPRVPSPGVLVPLLYHAISLVVSTKTCSDHFEFAKLRALCALRANVLLSTCLCILRF